MFVDAFSNIIWCHIFLHKFHHDESIYSLLLSCRNWTYENSILFCLPFSDISEYYELLRSLAHLMLSLRRLLWWATHFPSIPQEYNLGSLLTRHHHSSLALGFTKYRCQNWWTLAARAPDIWDGSPVTAPPPRTSSSCTMSPPSPHLATVTLLVILGSTSVHCLLGAAVWL